MPHGVPIDSPPLVVGDGEQQVEPVQGHRFGIGEHLHPLAVDQLQQLRSPAQEHTVGGDREIGDHPARGVQPGFRAVGRPCLSGEAGDHEVAVVVVDEGSPHRPIGSNGDRGRIEAGRRTGKDVGRPCAGVEAEQARTLSASRFCGQPRVPTWLDGQGVDGADDIHAEVSHLIADPLGAVVADDRKEAPIARCCLKGCLGYPYSAEVVGGDERVGAHGDRGLEPRRAVPLQQSGALDGRPKGSVGGLRHRVGVSQPWNLDHLGKGGAVEPDDE